MATRRYLLVIPWSWDHHHDEFATIELEGTEEHLESQERAFLANPNEAQGDLSLATLKKLADAHPGGNPVQFSVMRKLYRVTGGDINEREGKLELKLTPIMEFDMEGKPIARVHA